jgi:hypothetical protein
MIANLQQNKKKYNMRKAINMCLMSIIILMIINCRHPHQDIKKVISSKNMLHSKILKLIENHNVVFYKDFNLFTMKGDKEISIEKVRLPYVLVLRDSLDYPVEIGFFIHDLYRSYSDLLKQDNYFVNYSAFFENK